MSKAHHRIPVDPRVGLEVHVRLATRAKLLCACPADADLPPNAATCPVCVGLPGSMPVLNRRAVELALAAAHLLGCEVPARSAFDRKHYAYPDLPKGYQVTQDARPLARGGSLELSSGRRVALTGLHLEEDAGRSRHEAGATLVDLNRAGVALVEVVTEPVLRSGAEVRDFLARLREELRFAGISDGDMERGSLRCDVNVSLATRGADGFARVELKNLNSIRAAGAAVADEFERQRRLLEGLAAGEGPGPSDETRRWDADGRCSVPMRAKEAAVDYRFLPEPDLPELELGDGPRRPARVGPLERRRRWTAAHPIEADDAVALCASRALADYLDACLAAGSPARATAKWLLNDPDPALAHGAPEGATPRLAPEHLAELLGLVEGGAISTATARGLAPRLAAATDEIKGTGGSVPRPADLVAALGLSTVTDEAALSAAVEAALAARPDAVDSYRAGREQALEVLVGQVMARTGGRADAAVVRRLLAERLRA